MSNGVLFEITGFAEFEGKLKNLSSDKDKRREIIAVLRRVAKDTVVAAKAEAPVSKRAAQSSIKLRRQVAAPGTLRDSIQVITARRAEEPTVVVGPSAKGKAKGWYGHIVEYGHNIYRGGFKRKHSNSEKARAHNATGARKRVEANAFMARAYDKTKGRASEESAAKIAKYLQKRIDKLSTVR